MSSLEGKNFSVHQRRPTISAAASMPCAYFPDKREVCLLCGMTPSG